MSLMFYYAPMTSSTRVHWALEELGVPYEKVKIDLAKGEQRGDAYLALNPNGKVPLLVDSGRPIFESLAMLVHLGETYGVDKGLYPPPGLDRADALKWIAWVGVTLGDAVTRLLRNTSERFPKEEQNAAAGASAKADAIALLKIADRALEGREYLVGRGFTFADLALAGYLPFMARIGVPMDGLPNVQALLGRCMQRPALARAMQG